MASMDEDDVPLAQLPMRGAVNGAPLKNEPVSPRRLAPIAVQTKQAGLGLDDDDDNDNKPLVAMLVSTAAADTKRPAPSPTIKAVPSAPKSKIKDDSDDEDDKPLHLLMQPKTKTESAKKPPAAPLPAMKAAQKQTNGSAPTVPSVKKTPVPLQSGVKRKASVREDDDEDDDDAPLIKHRTQPHASNVTSKTASVKAHEKAATKIKNKKDVSGSPKKTKTMKKESSSQRSEGDDDEKDEDDEDDEEYRWWENMDEDGEIKWHTLEHNGVLFPPAYIPHKVPLIYDGKQTILPPAAEEVATFYAALVDTDWGRNPVFQKNFFRDFLAVLKDCEKEGYPPSPIRDFAKCNFSLIAAHLAKLKEQKVNRTKEEKAVEKAEKKKIDDKFGWAILDGRKEKVGNFRIEPPGLFRGRGAHPKAGTLKRRVLPEQVTINIGQGAVVPPPPPGHKWAKVIHDNTVTWLATWIENVNGATKYVWLAANSTLKAKSDMKKYDKARELKKHITKIRKVYNEELRDSKTVIRQRATAMYLIDKLALRAGNEKDVDEEADTVGCCSLRIEHIQLREPNTVIFDFLGKDSMRYYNEVTVEPIVFKNLQIFRRGNKDDNKREGDMLFDRINTTLVNKHLNSLMPGLTAKVFRTYNASITFQAELEKTPPEAVNVHELVLAYNRANRQAAILCNHQRSVPKSFDISMMKLSDKVRVLKYQRRQLRRLAVKEDKKAAKHYPDEMAEESDFDDEAMSQTEQILDRMDKEKEEKLRQKAEKAGEVYTPPAPRKRELASMPMETIIKKIHALDERLAKLKTEITDRDENKTTALGTSKINYLDPRISVAWCKKHSVPWDKVFNKSLQEKFKWAWQVADDKFVF